MIITGIITLIISVAFWYVILLYFLPSFQDRYSVAVFRFLFPDSPTTAWFLTPEERKNAVRRIRVNQTGVENKTFKRDQ